MKLTDRQLTDAIKRKVLEVAKDRIGLMTDRSVAHSTMVTLLGYALEDAVGELVAEGAVVIEDELDPRYRVVGTIGGKAGE